MATYQGVLSSANHAVAINLSDAWDESLLIQMAGGTTPVVVLEVSLDGGTTWNDVEVEDLDALGTALDTMTADGLYQPRASHFGAATQARVRLVSIVGGNVTIWATSARR